jgi:hypothetical protein
VPAHAYDTAQVLYRTVNSEGHVMYRQNFYSVPWQRIGELLPVRVTDKEWIVYGPDVREIARHPLYPSGITREKHSLPEHAPGRDHHQKYERLKERFGQLGPDGVLFLEELVRTRRCGKNEAARVLGLLATYHREDLVRALQRATRYRAFSWSAVERILAAQARPRSVRESLLADLTASLADKTLPARLRRYTNPELLIIDEFGFDRIERTECPQAAHLLYKIIASRNQKRSTALVTNVDFDKWGEYLSDGPLAMAFLDRLVEGAIILKVKGKSYRAPEAKAGENNPV